MKLLCTPTKEHIVRNGHGLVYRYQTSEGYTLISSFRLPPLYEPPLQIDVEKHDLEGHFSVKSVHLEENGRYKSNLT